MTISKFIIKTLAVISLPCLIFSCAHKQNKKITCTGFQDTILHKVVYKTPDLPPEPEGGSQQIAKLINKNFKYPPGEVEYMGKVLVAFVVETNGTIDGQRTIYDPSGNDRFFSKQLLAILSSVKWKPGVCNSEAVPTLYTFPLNIDLSE